MLARCARCQGTFTTDRFGRQTCPHCGSELILPEPPAPQGAPPGPQGAPPEAPAPPPAPEAPPPPRGGGQELPPPPGPPPGGYGPPGGWPPPPPPAGGGGWGSYPPPPPGPPGGPELPSPFADRARRGFFRGFFETWKLAATQPQLFFSRVRIDQTGAALLFAVISFTVGSAAEALYSILSREQMLVALDRFSRFISPDQIGAIREAIQGTSSGRALAQVVVAPVIALVVVYLVSAVLHLVLMLFRGASRGFDATVTVVAHAVGLTLLLAVPLCGTPIAIVWATVVSIVGLGAAQRCGPKKATAAVLAPLFLVCICCCGALGLSVPTLLKGMHQAAEQGQRVNL